jgi:ABC-2 type transport system ATP-binding protein
MGSGSAIIDDTEQTKHPNHSGAVFMSATVSVTHLAKSFGRFQAVKDVSFDVYPGEIFGMLGPNGAGKTTSIRMMLDIFKPDGGSVTIFGGEMTEAKKNRIGYLPEERGLYQDLKLEPTLVYLATLKGSAAACTRRRRLPRPWSTTPS